MTRGPALLRPASRRWTTCSSNSSAQARRNFLLIGSLAVLEAGAHVSGIYGVVGYTVVQRTREIGVRVALGATRRQVMRLVVGRRPFQAVVGVAPASPPPDSLNPLMRDLLFEISPTDPTTFAGVGSTRARDDRRQAIPARRAMRIDR